MACSTILPAVPFSILQELSGSSSFKMAMKAMLTPFPWQLQELPIPSRQLSAFIFQDPHSSSPLQTAIDFLSWNYVS